MCHIFDSVTWSHIYFCSIFMGFNNSKTVSIWRLLYFQYSYFLPASALDVLWMSGIGWDESSWSSMTLMVSIESTWFWMSSKTAGAIFVISLWFQKTDWFLGQQFKRPLQKFENLSFVIHSLMFKRNPQCPGIDFNKILNSTHKKYIGLTSMLQGFPKCIAWNPSK